MYRFWVLLILFPVFATSGRITHYPCFYSYRSSTPPVPKWVWVEECDASGCAVPNGSTRSLRTGFSATSTHQRVSGKMKTFLLGMEFPMEQPTELANLCDHIQDGCPIFEGSPERIAELSITGMSPISGVTVRVELSVMDADTGHVIACGGVSRLLLSV
ncbi:hypothetical protein DMENIID0001_019490 [Sergentomyia squamirostris]